jgi:hypothetical protein
MYREISFPSSEYSRNRKQAPLTIIKAICILRIEIVKGILVTPILGAYHLPANERPRITALVT